ncbi:glycosyltransferase family 4 protein [Cellulomonas sp. NPDC057328]|uniref:glycosyltransferase family 4 protein n=1 Tax=Cellulomonas sp. NPDC057328 TaxID=3346101 RepID=UPI00362EFB25
MATRQTPAAEALRVALVVEQLWQPVPGGSGTYVRRLVEALAARPDVAATGVAARHDADPTDGRLPVPVVASRLPRTALYEAWSRLGAPRVEALAGLLDVVHATTWAVPATARPLVVTVHDLAFLDDPTHFTRRGNAFFRRALAAVRARAAAVVVPSHATAADCRRHGLPADRLHVVPHGVQVPAVGADAVAALRERWGLRRDYVLWCGTREPRKNLDRLVEAFTRVAPPDVDLVLVGPTGWGDVRAGEGGAIRVLGRLPEADLHAAYAGARAFAFPSVREGFGLPVLEAMAHGVPVLTSRGTACAEVAGDTAVLVDPLNVPAIARGLEAVLHPDAAELGARGRARADGFTWDQAAASTLAVYRSAV